MQRVVARDVLTANVQPSRECDTTVDAQNLLVAAQVEEWHSPGNSRVHEPRDRHTSLPQSVIRRRREIVAPNPIDENTDLDTTAHRPDQRIDEAGSRSVSSKNITR